MNFGALLQGVMRMFKTVVGLSNNDTSKQRVQQVSDLVNAGRSVQTAYYSSGLNSLGTFFGG